MKDWKDELHGLDLDAIYELGNKWVQLGDILYERSVTLSLQRAFVRWSGEAGDKAAQAWDDGPARSLRDSADAAWKVGEAIQNYADQIKKQAEDMAKKENASLISAIIGMILNIVTFGIGVAIGPILNIMKVALQRVVYAAAHTASVLERAKGVGAAALLDVGGAVSHAAGRLAGAIPGFNIGAGLALGAGTALAFDEAVGAAGAAAAGSHHETNWEMEAWNMGLGAGMGAGLGALGGLGGKGGKGDYVPTRYTMNYIFRNMPPPTRGLPKPGGAGGNRGGFTPPGEPGKGPSGPGPNNFGGGGSHNTPPTVPGPNRGGESSADPHSSPTGPGKDGSARPDDFGMPGPANPTRGGQNVPAPEPSRTPGSDGGHQPPSRQPEFHGSGQGGSHPGGKSPEPTPAPSTPAPSGRGAHPGPDGEQMTPPPSRQQPAPQDPPATETPSPPASSSHVPGGGHPVEPSPHAAGQDVPGGGTPAGAPEHSGPSSAPHQPVGEHEGPSAPNPGGEPTEPGRAPGDGSESRTPPTQDEFQGSGPDGSHPNGPSPQSPDPPATAPPSPPASSSHVPGGGHPVEPSAHAPGQDVPGGGTPAGAPEHSGSSSAPHQPVGEHEGPSAPNHGGEPSAGPDSSPTGQGRDGAPGQYGRSAEDGGPAPHAVEHSGTERPGGGPGSGDPAEHVPSGGAPVPPGSRLAPESPTHDPGGGGHHPAPQQRSPHDESPYDASRQPPGRHDGQPAQVPPRGRGLGTESGEPSVAGTGGGRDAAVPGRGGSERVPDGTGGAGSRGGGGDLAPPRSALRPGAEGQPTPVSRPGTGAGPGALAETPHRGAGEGGRSRGAQQSPGSAEPHEPAAPPHEDTGARPGARDEPSPARDENGPTHSELTPRDGSAGARGDGTRGGGGEPGGPRQGVSETSSGPVERRGRGGGAAGDHRVAVPRSGRPEGGSSGEGSVTMPGLSRTESDHLLTEVRREWERLGGSGRVEAGDVAAVRAELPGFQVRQPLRDQGLKIAEILRFGESRQLGGAHGSGGSRSVSDPDAMEVDGPGSGVGRAGSGELSAGGPGREVGDVPGSGRRSSSGSAGDAMEIDPPEPGHREPERGESAAAAPEPESSADIAQHVISEVGRRIRYGAPNQWSSVAAAGGNPWEMLLHGTRDESYQVQPGSLQQYLGQNAAAAETIGVGNCGEHAAMSFCLLNSTRLPPGSRIWYINLNRSSDETITPSTPPSIDHVFTAFGDPSNPRDIMIVDPWQKDARPVRAEDFNFPVLVESGNGDVELTPRAQEIEHDGHDYLVDGHEMLDPELQNRMDITGGDPFVPPRFVRDMYEHHMPPSGLRGGSADHGVDPIQAEWPVGRDVTVMEPRHGGTSTVPREDVPAAFSERGKGKEPEAWHSPELSYNSSSSRMTYEVSDSGVIRIPGGETIGPEGWRAFGDDFIHEETGHVLRGDNGWVGRVANFEEVVRAWDSLHPGADSHSVHVAPSGMYLVPRGGTGDATHIPFHRPSEGEGAVGAEPRPVESADGAEPAGGAVSETEDAATPPASHGQQDGTVAPPVHLAQSDRNPTPGPGAERRGEAPGEGGTHSGPLAERPVDAAGPVEPRGAGAHDGDQPGGTPRDEQQHHQHQQQQQHHEKVQRYHEFRLERDERYRERTNIEEAFQQRVGDLGSEIEDGAVRFAQEDRFGGRYVPEGSAARQHVRDSYEKQLNDKYHELAEEAGTSQFPEAEWHQAHEDLHNGLTDHFARASERMQSLETAKHDFEQALTNFRGKDLFNGRHLPKDDPFFNPHASADVDADSGIAHTKFDDEEWVPPAERSTPPETLRDLFERTEEKYVQAVDNAFGEGRTPRERASALESRHEDLREDMAHEIEALNERERSATQAENAFNEHLEDQAYDEHFEFRPDRAWFADEATQARAVQELKNDIRAAHARLLEETGGDVHSDAFASRWDARFREMTSPEAWESRKEYGSLREGREADAEQYFEGALDRFDDEVGNFPELGEAGRERVTQEWDKAVENALAEDWFGHHGRPDFRGGAHDGKPGELSGRREGGAPPRSWEESLADLRESAGARIEHEAMLQEQLRGAARDYHDLLGHPEDMAYHNHMNEESVQKIGEEYRSETIRKFDELWAPDEHNTKEWLQHENKHENAFEERVSTERTTPLENAIPHRGGERFDNSASSGRDEAAEPSPSDSNGSNSSNSSNKDSGTAAEDHGDSVRISRDAPDKQDMGPSAGATTRGSESAPPSRTTEDVQNGEPSESGQKQSLEQARGPVSVSPGPERSAHTGSRTPESRAQQVTERAEPVRPTAREQREETAAQPPRLDQSDLSRESGLGTSSTSETVRQDRPSDRPEGGSARTEFVDEQRPVDDSPGSNSPVTRDVADGEPVSAQETRAAPTGDEARVRSVADRVAEDAYRGGAGRDAARGAVSASGTEMGDGELAQRLGLDSDQAADAALCVDVLEQVRDGLHPRPAVEEGPSVGGRPVDRSQDDLDLPRGRGRRRLAPDGSWSRVTGWHEVADTLRPGETGLFLWHRQGQPGHAIAVHRSGEGLRWIDPTASPRQRVTEEPPTWDAIDAHALVLTPEGVERPHVSSDSEAHSTSAALVDPAGDTRHGVPTWLRNLGSQFRDNPVLPMSRHRIHFTNVGSNEPAFGQKASRLLSILAHSSSITNFQGGRHIAITLERHNMQTPAHVTDNDLAHVPQGDRLDVGQGDRAGVEVSLAAYYFETYPVGYIAGMLAHEFGIHPVATARPDILDNEFHMRDMPFPVPGLGVPTRIMTTTGAGSDQHILGAYPSTERFATYRQVVSDMADHLWESVVQGDEGARVEDITDLFHTYLMDISSIAATNDHRNWAAPGRNLAASVGITSGELPERSASEYRDDIAIVYNHFRESFLDNNAFDLRVAEFMPGPTTPEAVRRDFWALIGRVASGVTGAPSVATYAPLHHSTGSENRMNPVRDSPVDSSVSGAIQSGSHQSSSYPAVDRHPASGSRHVGLRGGSRDVGVDPLAAHWPVGRPVTVGEPRYGGLTKVSAERAPAADGKSAERWFTFQRPSDSRSAPMEYEVSDAGRVSLPDGEVLSSDGWVSFGHDFVHQPTGAYLRGDSGWIGHVANPGQLAENLGELDPNTTPHTLAADSSGLYLVPDDQQAAVHLPLRNDAAEIPENAGEHPAHTDQAHEPADRRRVLVLSDVSGFGLGGVPVFNMELVRGLSASHDVTMLTVDPDAEYDPAAKGAEHGDARISNVPLPGGREALESLVRHSPDVYGLPTEPDAFDLVVGHSRFSGPAAQSIRDLHYPGARLVHFLHTSPLRLDRIKDQPAKGGEKAKAERLAMRDADLVVGVGKLLADEGARLSEQIGRVAGVHEFVPGAELGELVHPESSADGTLRLLLPGRATDEIKGVGTAIQAVGKVSADGVPVHLTVRGGPKPGTPEHEQWESFAEEHAPGGVTLKPFTTDPKELSSDRESTDAVIMPSLHEGFGLVATEAAGRGIPTLVNAESGAADFFARYPTGQKSVVDSFFEVGVPENEESRIDAWAAEIRELSRNLPQRQDHARRLREDLRDYSWQQAASSLVSATLRTPAPQRDLPAWQRSGLGPVTRQGPEGSVNHLGQREEWQPTERWDGSTPMPSRKPLAHGGEHFNRILEEIDLAVPEPPRSSGQLSPDVDAALDPHLDEQILLAAARWELGRLGWDGPPVSADEVSETRASLPREQRQLPLSAQGDAVAHALAERHGLQGAAADDHSAPAPEGPAVSVGDSARAANPWKLSEAENRRIFEEEVLPRALQGIRRPDTPRIVFIGGQAASGKTTGQQAARERLHEDGAIVADFDALLADHPQYEEMRAEDDSRAAEWAGDDAIVWMKGLIRYAMDNGYNLLREGAMGGGSTEKEALGFKEHGFRAEADVMAVPYAVSRLSNLHRYQAGREATGAGRLVSVGIHDKAYEGIPKTLQGVHEKKFLDEIRLHRRDGTQIYRNSLDEAGEWTEPGSARQALEEERSRPVDDTVAEWLHERYAHLARTLPHTERSQLPEIAKRARPLGVDLTEDHAVRVPSEPPNGMHDAAGVRSVADRVAEDFYRAGVNLGEFAASRTGAGEDVGLAQRLGLDSERAAEAALCVSVLEQVRDGLHPRPDVPEGPSAGGRPVHRSQDDLDLPRGRGRRRLAPDGLWSRVSGWQQTAEGLRPGETAFFLWHRRARPGHAIAVHRSSEGLRWIDPTAPAGQRVTEEPPTWDAVDAHALVLTPEGAERPGVSSGGENHSTLAALLDPAGDTRHGVRGFWGDALDWIPGGNPAAVVSVNGMEFANVGRNRPDFVEKAHRLLELLADAPSIVGYQGNRRITVTLESRSMSNPASIIDRGADGVDVHLAAYYFETYSFGYVAGMLAHEFGIHRVASSTPGLVDDEAGLYGMPIVVAGLAPEEAMNTEGAEQPDHVLGAWPSTDRFHSYQNVVLEMARGLWRDVDGPGGGASPQDITDLFHAYLMDLASIAATNDHRGRGLAWSPDNWREWRPADAARVRESIAGIYNQYRRQLPGQQNFDQNIGHLLPGNTTPEAVSQDYTALVWRVVGGVFSAPSVATSVREAPTTSGGDAASFHGTTATTVPGGSGTRGTPGPAVSAAQAPETERAAPAPESASSTPPEESAAVPQISSPDGSSPSGSSPSGSSPGGSSPGISEHQAAQLVRGALEPAFVPADGESAAHALNAVASAESSALAGHPWPAGAEELRGLVADRLSDDLNREPSARLYWPLLDGLAVTRPAEAADSVGATDSADSEQPPTDDQRTADIREIREDGGTLRTDRLVLAAGAAVLGVRAHVLLPDGGQWQAGPPRGRPVFLLLLPRSGQDYGRWAGSTPVRSGDAGHDGSAQPPAQPPARQAAPRAQAGVRGQVTPTSAVPTTGHSPEAAGVETFFEASPRPARDGNRAE